MELVISMLLGETYLKKQVLLISARSFYINVELESEFCNNYFMVC